MMMMTTVRERKEDKTKVNCVCVRVREKVTDRYTVNKRKTNSGVGEKGS
jgi:hypothetical protein